jgi:thymidylate kinase
MLYIIEGANYVGKTTTLDILKKKKSFITFYHPRFNDSQHYSFQYNVANTMFCKPNVDNVAIHVPRDVVYQISHMTCLKYLTSIKEKKVLLDRCFLSEMVYNELYDQKIYHEFINVLKSSFDYTIYLLTVNDDKALEKRIIERLKKDATKGYGIRDSKGFVPEPATVEDKMKAQRKIEASYRCFVDQFKLNCVEIDTSDKSKKQVADAIKGAANV